MSLVDQESTIPLNGSKVEAESSNGDSGKKLNCGYPRQLAATLTMSLLELVGGTVAGWIAPAQLTLMSEETPLSEPLTLQQLASLATVSVVGSVLANISFSWWSAKISMKIILFVISVILVICWIVLAISPYYYLIVTARFVMGFGVSAAGMCAMSYVAAIAHRTFRGSFITLLSLGHHLGFVYSNVLGTNLSYRWFTASCLIIPIVFITLFTRFPESPMWLASRGDIRKARDSLMFFRSNNAQMVDEEIDLLGKKEGEEGSFKKLVSTRASRRALEISVVLAFLFQFSGQIPMMLFTFAILEEAQSAVPAGILAILLGITKVIFFLLSSTIVDKVGRKPLLFFSYGTMAAVMFLLGLHFKLLQEGIFYPFYHVIPSVLVIAFISAQSSGASFMFALLISETLPPYIRPQGFSVIFTSSSFFFVVSVSIYPLLQSWMGYYYLFWLFCVCDLAAFLFTWFRIPETKKMPVEEVIQLLERS